MVEIEHVYEAEVVESHRLDEKDETLEIPSWEELVSEFVEGSRYELHGQLRQARAAASVCRHYGRSSMKAFAGEVGKSPSWCYELARVWFVYGHIFEEGGQLSNRLETLGITQLVRALRAPEPVEMAIEAHDNGYSARQIEEITASREEVGVEVAEMMTCPKCGGEGKVPRE